MLTNASKYAIRSVLFLAQKSSMNNKYSAKLIAKELDIPLHFIAKLLQPLVKNDIISSLKGPTGGFYFTDENGKKKVCDIINTIQGDDVFNHCFMGLERCSGVNPCPIHHIVAPFKEKLLESFEMKTLTEFSDEVLTQEGFLTLKSILKGETSINDEG